MKATYLFEVLGVSMTELQDYIDVGLIRRQTHKSEPLAILNYTEKAAFAKHWDGVTSQCRGLIYNTETQEVVARPFPKFFNNTEEQAPKFVLDEMVYVTDKQDGSLGILYQLPAGGWAIATRGSFHSEQAEHATELLRSKYAGWYKTQMACPTPHVTALFEIVYPKNRIVLNYGDQDDLVVLGMVDIETGDIHLPNVARVFIGWPGPQTSTLGYMGYGAALALTPRENAEGVVIRAENDNRMVKIKQEDYVRLHRIITGLNARSVWEHMGDNDYDSSGLKETLPEEFWPWIDEVAESLLNQEASLWETIENEYFQKVVVGGDRGQQARAFAGSENAWALFAYLDEDYARVHKGIWKRIKPDADQGPNTRTPEEEMKENI